MIVVAIADGTMQIVETIMEAIDTAMAIKEADVK